MSWDFFTKRRRVDPETFIRQHKIRTYEDFVSALVRRGVLPPTQEVIASLLSEYALGDDDLWDAFRPEAPPTWDDLRPVAQEEPKVEPEVEEIKVESKVEEPQKKLVSPSPPKKVKKVAEKKKTKSTTTKPTAKKSRTSRKKTSTAS